MRLMAADREQGQRGLGLMAWKGNRLILLKILMALQPPLTFGDAQFQMPVMGTFGYAAPGYERAEAPGLGAGGSARSRTARLEGRYPMRGAREVAALADGCLAMHAGDRPTRREVVERLRQAMRHTEMDGAVGAVEC
ncbi:putative receptor-like protein kinase [Panicum miliaceum]|uniref:Receptor-like protein kinase n=1 Tax=Panicum miliaceum TaxID=4540 RepID=A0A3L6Q7U9_PANMI|nr:putative receptor-like protein kinase [Panicum miliaceum]